MKTAQSWNKINNKAREAQVAQVAAGVETQAPRATSPATSAAPTDAAAPSVLPTDTADDAYTALRGSNTMVSFDIDANGILNVSAKDKATGKEQSITVNSTSTLSDDEIEQIIEENELYEVQLKG